MADVRKAEKLAAARKKLKEFQQKSKDSSSGVKPTSRKNGGITNNDVNTTRNFVFDSGPPDPEGTSTSFASVSAFHEPGPPSYESLDFISSVPVYSDNDQTGSLVRSSPDSNRSSGNVSLDRSSARDFFDHLPGQTQDWLAARQPPQDCPAGDYEVVADCITTEAGARPIVHETVSDSLVTETVAPEEDSPPPTATVGARSTSESIRQLSQQMNGLMGESGQGGSGGASELECRNQELAALLDVERQAREQLQLQIKEYQAHVSQLSSQLESRRADSESQSNRELTSVREQLTLHVQTVAILVAEKTELQSALTHCQADAKLRVAETQDLQGRLKASRYRVSELEKEVSALRTALESSEASRQLASNELDRLRLELTEAAARELEWEEERSELTHRLSAKCDECSELTGQLHETRTRLSLAQLRVTQLGSDDGADNNAQMEALHQAKICVEQRVKELESALKTSESDNDRSSQQFQQYVRGVETQVSELTERVAGLEADKQALLGREQSLTGHLAELEKRIQIQDVHKPERTPTPDPKLQERLSHLETEKEALSEEMRALSLRSGDLEAGLLQRETRIEELEAMVERMQGDQPDQGRLLAAMESDKVAAARAVSQNQRLKVELQELQDGFVTLSNCKLDLTDKLEHERHRSRQLEEQMTQLRTHLADHQHAHHQHADLEARARVDELSTQNDELRKLVARLTALQGQAPPPEGMEAHEKELIASLSATVQQLESEKDRLREQLSQLEGAKPSPASVTREAMDQLQEQFTRKMAEIADLSDEKQRLEHLVLQLQGETETIDSE